MRYLLSFILVFLAVAAFLVLRKWFDRKKEKSQDMEIVREGEEHLGSWAHKSPGALIQFRLHRDGKFSYSIVEYPKSDTIKVKGRYRIIGAVAGRSANYYPRLVAIDEKNDTLFNYFIAYITPYDAHALDNGYDKMVLNPKGIYDTVGYTFYRIKQN